MGLSVAWRKMLDKNPIKNGIFASEVSAIPILFEFFLLKIEQKRQNDCKIWKVCKDENNWKTKYPNVAMKIEELEAKIEKLEKEN